MKMKNHASIVLSAFVLVGVIAVAGISASATGGDQTDPLITLSYLTQVVKPELMEMVDEQVAANETALSEKIDAAIADYSEQMEQMLEQNDKAGSSYVTVKLAAGNILIPAAGSEILLCSGSVKLTSDSASVLYDTTAGSSLNKGSALAANHLYLVPVDETGIAATANSVLLVRGDYFVI